MHSRSKVRSLMMSVATLDFFVVTCGGMNANVSVPLSTVLCNTSALVDCRGGGWSSSGLLRRELRLLERLRGTKCSTLLRLTVRLEERQRATLCKPSGSSFC